MAKITEVRNIMVNEGNYYISSLVLCDHKASVMELARGLRVNFSFSCYIHLFQFLRKAFFFVPLCDRYKPKNLIGQERKSLEIGMLKITASVIPL